MTSTRTRSRARKGEGELLRESILDVTERLLIDLGNADSVSVRAVAEAAGVTPPSIYLHFADKDALIMAVCRRTFARFADVQRRALEGVQSPLDRIRARGTAYCHWGVQHPEEYRICFMDRHDHGASDSDVIELLTEAGFFDLINDINRGIEEGTLAGEPMVIATTLWISVHGLTSLRISHPDFPWGDLDAEVAGVADVFLAGMSTQSKKLKGP